MAKTKILVIQLKEIIYTVIFAALGILLILLLIFMFKPDKKDQAAQAEGNLYTAGVYTSSITLNDMVLNLEVVVDQDRIKSISIKNIDEAVTAMYPLVDPSLEAIKTQLYNDVPIDQLELQEDKKYTQQLIIDAINRALDKAKKIGE
jgi:cbb3-type cytochrome oxidase subunit 3